MTDTAQPPVSGGEEALELFDRANAAYNAGDFLAAVGFLDGILSMEPGNVVAMNNRGAALDALGRREQAEESYRAAISGSRDYELAWHNLANCLMAQERHGEAAKAYARAARLNPGRVENLVGLAEARIERGNRRKARAAITSLDRAAEKDSAVLLTQADLYAQMSAWDDAVRCCERYVELNPDDAEGHSQLGGVLHESGRFDLALQSYERALSISPRSPQIRNNYGYACFCAGDINRALAAFDRAIDIDPEYKHAWYNKGYALHGVDRLEEAVQCYRRALEIDPHDRVLLNNLGNALYNLGRYADSIPLFVRAICVDPDYEIAWNNIGNALEKMGRYSEAIPFHDRSLEIRPDFDYALYAKGVCKAATGFPEEGYDLILESLDRNPAYDEAWRARSRVARQLGRTDDAVMSIERALSLNPGFCEGWLDRGDIMLAADDGAGADGSYRRALACVERALESDVSDGASWMLKAEILSRLGMDEDALVSTSRAVAARNPESSAVPLAIEICRKGALPELPADIADAVDRSYDPETSVAFAHFMLSRGRHARAKEALRSHAPSELSPRGRSLLVRCLLEDGEVSAAEDAASACEGTERSRLSAQIHAHNCDWTAAVEALERVLRTEPRDHASLVALGRMRLRTGAPKEAIAAADGAIGVDPLDWEPHDMKAEAYGSMGLEERAERERAHAAELMGRCGGARRARV